MKCSKCGVIYSKQDHYCAKCGSKLIKQRQENLFLKSLILHKTKIISITILLVLFIAIFQIISYFRSPEYIASSYIKAIIHHDTSKILEIVDLEENEFYNKTILKEKNNFSNITNIELIKKIENNDHILFIYRYELEGKSNMINVSLSKSDHLFYPWSVNSGRVSKNITFKVPKGAQITVDDISLTSYLDEPSSTDDYDIYKIDYMATGNYKIDLILKDGTTISDHVNIYDQQTYSIGHVQLSSENQSFITSLSKEFVNQLYHSLISDADPSSLDYMDQIKDTYKDLRYWYKNSNFKLNSIDYTDLEIIKAYYNENQKLEVILETEYNYAISYGESENTNTYEGTNRGYITLEFDYDHQYIICKINQLKNNFPIRK